MGSYAQSINQSSTAYTNAPIAQENVSNPINLSNSAGVRLNSNDVKMDVKGNYSNTTLDGGAISQAFTFGEKAVNIIADLTRSNNQSMQAANMEATKLASQAAAGLDKNANQAALTDWTQNKTLIFGGVLVAIAYFYFRK